ncbi:hypothetical protein [Embleya sp. NPDC001921]
MEDVGALVIAGGDGAERFEAVGRALGLVAAAAVLAVEADGAYAPSAVAWAGVGLAERFGPVQVPVDHLPAITPPAATPVRRRVFDGDPTTEGRRANGSGG